MTHTELQHYIHSRQIHATILPMDQPTPTVPEAARVLGVDPAQIIKTLLFIVKDDPLLVIKNGNSRVDRRKMAMLRDVGRSRIKLASADQTFEISGYVVGSMPPFGHKLELPTWVDTAVFEQEVIYGGGGATDKMLRLTTTELLRVTKAELVEISESN